MIQNMRLTLNTLFSHGWSVSKWRWLNAAFAAIPDNVVPSSLYFGRSATCHGFSPLLPHCQQEAVSKRSFCFSHDAPLRLECV